MHEGLMKVAFSAEKQRSGNAEIVTQINPAHIFVFHDFVGFARHQHLAVMQNISPINDFERFTNIVIGDQNADPAFL